MDNSDIAQDRVTASKTSLGKMQLSLAMLVKGLKQQAFEDVLEHADDGNRSQVEGIVPLSEIFAN